MEIYLLVAKNIGQNNTEHEDSFEELPNIDTYAPNCPDIIDPNSTVANTFPQDSNHMSPLLFRTYLKLTGRPKKAKAGVPQFNKKSSDKTKKPSEPKSRRRGGGGRKRSFADILVEDNITPSTPGNTFINHTSL